MVTHARLLKPEQAHVQDEALLFLAFRFASAHSRHWSTRHTFNSRINGSITEASRGGVFVERWGRPKKGATPCSAAPRRRFSIHTCVKRRSKALTRQRTPNRGATPWSAAPRRRFSIHTCVKRRSKALTRRRTPKKGATLWSAAPRRRFFQC